MLLIDDFKKLKEKIVRKKDIIKGLCQNVERSMSEFGEESMVEEGKLGEGVRNVELRVKILESKAPENN